jgi:hypothetical protein
MKYLFLLLGLICINFAQAVTYSFALNWTDTSNNEDGFRIYFRNDPNGSWEQLNEISTPNIETYVDTREVSNGDHLEYRVSAFNFAAEASSDAAVYNVIISIRENGWIYWIKINDSAYFWDDLTGWWWTSESVLPYVLNLNRNEWKTIDSVYREVIDSD